MDKELTYKDFDTDWEYHDYLMKELGMSYEDAEKYAGRRYPASVVAGLIPAWLYEYHKKVEYYDDGKTNDGKEVLYIDTRRLSDDEVKELEKHLQDTFGKRVSIKRARSEYAPEQKKTVIVVDDKIEEGVSKDMTPEEIAKKHKVSVDKINKQLEKGIKVEEEHTDDENKARRIALDHLFEIPDYYDRLGEMEKGALKEDTNNSNGKYVVSLYEKYPLYEPAEGGYYYDGIELIETHDGFETLDKAKEELVRWAKEEEFEYINDEYGYARDEDEWRHIGEGQFMQVESNVDDDYDDVGSQESGRKIYEDTVKTSSGKWVNKGKEGTHGTFKTKKAADAQRKAMFANKKMGATWGEGLEETFNNPNGRTIIEYNGTEEFDVLDKIRQKYGCKFGAKYIGRVEIVGDKCDKVRDDFGYYQFNGYLPENLKEEKVAKVDGMNILQYVDNLMSTYNMSEEDAWNEADIAFGIGEINESTKPSAKVRNAEELLKGKEARRKGYKLTDEDIIIDPYGDKTKFHFGKNVIAEIKKLGYSNSFDESIKEGKDAQKVIDRITRAKLKGLDEVATDALESGYIEKKLDELYGWQLAALWSMCMLSEENDYSGQPYDDEVYDAISKRVDGENIFELADEIYAKFFKKAKVENLKESISIDDDLVEGIKYILSKDLPPYGDDFDFDYNDKEYNCAIEPSGEKGWLDVVIVDNEANEIVMVETYPAPPYAQTGDEGLWEASMDIAERVYNQLDNLTESFSGFLKYKNWLRKNGKKDSEESYYDYLQDTDKAFKSMPERSKRTQVQNMFSHRYMNPVTEGNKSKRNKK